MSRSDQSGCRIGIDLGGSKIEGIPQCWCGRKGCLETWVSGPGMAADHARMTGETVATEEIAARAELGNEAARATLSRHAARLARGLAHVVNIIDPDVIVLGGGLSQLSHLYAASLTSLAALGLRL